MIQHTEQQLYDFLKPIVEEKGFNYKCQLKNVQFW